MKVAVNCHDIAKCPSIPMTHLQSCAEHLRLLLLNRTQRSFHLTLSSETRYRSCNDSTTWMVCGENCVHDFPDTAYHLMVSV
jgi:hypothetical protein